MTSMLTWVVERLLALTVRLITAPRGIWLGTEPVIRQRIFFANHVSHGDFVLIWAVLPPPLRRLARPVAGRDYWTANKVRRFIGEQVFRSVLIDRDRVSADRHPITTMTTALDDGASLIVFPEGTRNTTGQPLLPFKPGLFHLAKARPDVDLVPVWVDNLNRVMPKGEFIPIPIICTVTFGAPLHIEGAETKAEFIERAQAALLALSAKPGSKL